MVVSIIFNPVESFFSSMAIYSLIVCVIFYVYQGYKREVLHEKVLMFGFASFWLSIAVARIYFYFVDFILEGTYTGDLSVILQTYDVERYIYLYFYLYLYVYIFVNVIILSIIFVWFSIKLKREFKTISSVMTIGFAVFIIGWVFEAVMIKSLSLVSPVLPSILVISGALIALSPLILNLEIFAKTFINWIILITIVLIGVALSLALILNLELFVIVFAIVIIAVTVLVAVIGFVLYSYVRVVKVEPELDKEKLQDMLKIFTKPERIPVEDVQHSKEEQTCLVCKNKITRLNYICPNCSVLYCAKCSEALTTIENACWVCEAPFDESKPVKIEKKVEEEKVVIDKDN